MAVPLRLTVVVLPVDELLEMSMVPLALPATAGSKLTCSVNTCPGFNMAGSATFEIENAAPLTVTELTVTADVPDEVKVSGCVAVALSFELPNARLVELTARVGLDFVRTTNAPHPHNCHMLQRAASRRRKRPYPVRRSDRFALQ